MTKVGVLNAAADKIMQFVKIENVRTDIQWYQCYEKEKI